MLKGDILFYYVVNISYLCTMIRANVSPLAIYDSVDYQRHREFLEGGITMPSYPLIVPAHSFSSYQFVVTEDDTLLRTGGLIEFYTKDGDYVSTGSRSPKVLHLSGNTYLIYADVLSYEPSLDCGWYYAKIRIATPHGTKDYYTEVFESVELLRDYIHIRYNNARGDFDLPIGLDEYASIKFFNSTFCFDVYLRSCLAKPEYTYEDKVDARMGYPFRESISTKKSYRATYIAPEYLCDAMSILPLCDNVTIEWRGKVYKPISTSVNVSSWDGDLAQCELSFDVNNIVSNVGGIYVEPPQTADADSRFSIQFNDNFN